MLVAIEGTNIVAVLVVTRADEKLIIVLVDATLASLRPNVSIVGVKTVTSKKKSDASGFPPTQAKGKKKTSKL